EPVRSRIVAIGTSPHEQAAMLAAERQFRLVAGAATCHDGCVAGNAFLRAWRRCEAQVEVARLRGELAERANGDPVAHASTHCTWQTTTGMSWAAQKSSQRRWLSCKRSPGPFTSIIR